MNKKPINCFGEVHCLNTDCPFGHWACQKAWKERRIKIGNRIRGIKEDFKNEPS